MSAVVRLLMILTAFRTGPQQQKAFVPNAVDRHRVKRLEANL